MSTAQKSQTLQRKTSESEFYIDVSRTVKGAIIAVNHKCKDEKVRYDSKCKLEDDKKLSV